MSTASCRNLENVFELCSGAARLTILSPSKNRQQDGDVPHPDIVDALGRMADAIDKAAIIDHGVVVSADVAQGERRR
jgi:hypothetical protein